MTVADRLRGGREVAAQGRLSLDRQKAREKLRMFRLADPHFYVLQFVRAASVLGATRVEFEISANEVRCQFDAELRGELLQDIWGIAFEQREDRDAVATHYLALGLGSAQALDPSIIEVWSGPAYLRLDGEHEEFDPAAQAVFGTRIRLKERFRFGHIAEFFSIFGGDLAEIYALRARCSHALIEIVVNGRTLRPDASYRAGAEPFETETARGFVMLRPAVVGAFCEVLRDSVSVATEQLESLGVSMRSVVDSSLVLTDLSGLSVSAQSNVDTVVREVVIPCYHAQLQAYLRGASATRTEKLEVLGLAIRYLTAVEDSGEAVHPATRSLLDMLLCEPLFEDATKRGGAMISVLDSADSSGAFRVSGKRVVSTTTARVLLVEESTGGANELLAQLVVMEIRASSLGPIGSVTDSLERQQLAARNRELWLARPKRQRPHYEYVTEVEVDGLVGEVWLASKGAVVSSDRGLFLTADSRLVRHVASDIAIGVSVDGVATATFDDIERDARFDELATRLCFAAYDLLLQFAGAVRDSALEPRFPVLINLAAEALVHGRFSHWFLEKVMGYASGRELEGLATNPRLMGLWLVDDRPATLHRLLGPIVDLPGWKLADGTYTTLAALMSRGDLMVLPVSEDWAVFENTVVRELGTEVPGRIVLADAAQRVILRKTCPGISDARVEVQRLMQLRDFLKRPPFEDSTPEALIEGQEEVKHELGTITTMLVPCIEPGVSEVRFVWRERLLCARRRSGGVGSFRAVVSSDELTPNITYDDVVMDSVVDDLVKALNAASSRVLGRWWHARKEAGDPGTGDVLRQFVEAAITLAAADSDAVVLPVLRYENHVWKRGFASHADLRLSTSIDGGRLATSLHADPAPTQMLNRRSPVLLMAPGVRMAGLRKLFGSDIEFVTIDADEVPRGVDAEEAFLREPLFAGTIDDGPTTWEGVSGGLRCRTRLAWLASSGPCCIAHVLLHDRQLEILEVETPMGEFTAIVQGPAIVADPTYRFAEHPRAAILEIVRKGAANAIREACRSMAPSYGGVPLGVSQAPLLRRMLAVCLDREPEPPFDLALLLESTPLFPTGSGAWLSFRELRGLARDGVLEIAERSDRPDVLIVEPGQRLAMQAVLGDRYELAAVVDFSPMLSMPTHLDTLLGEVVRILLAARGERRDLFDDHLAESFEWAAIDSGALCDVNAERVAINNEHPLVAAVRADESEMSCAFLASAVYSAINAYYEEITDPDELELQARLVRSLRD